jgi:hypothetical protein
MKDSIWIIIFSSIAAALPFPRLELYERPGTFQTIRVYCSAMAN